MTDFQFDSQIERLRGAFGPRSFTPGRIELIATAVAPLTADEFERMVTEFVATMRRAPLPSDFALAVKSRKRYVRVEPTPAAIECNVCADMGVVRIVNQEEGIESLCRCSCKIGEGQVWRLPILTRKIRSAFTITKPPLEWFKPASTPTGDDREVSEQLMKVVWPLVRAWKKRVHAAEEWWASGWDSILSDDAPAHYMQDR